MASELIESAEAAIEAMQWVRPQRQGIYDLGVVARRLKAAIAAELEPGPEFQHGAFATESTP